MKSSYTRRGLTTLADYRRPRPKSTKEFQPLHSDDLLKKTKAALAEEPVEQKPKRPSWLVENPSEHLRRDTQPGTSWQRKDTRPPSSQRDDVDPYTDA